MNNISALPIVPVKAAVATKTAVGRFLESMLKATQATFPAWEKTLRAGIEDCALGYDEKREVLDQHPLDDYYFAGVVALATAKVRRLFEPAQAAEILSLVAEQVDPMANRHDRLVSDLVFFLIGRVDLASMDSTLPHDQIVHGLLVRLGVLRIEATAPLMDDLLFRHTLAEPLACGVPDWWSAFQRKYTLVDQLPAAAGGVVQFSRRSSLRAL